MAKTPFQTRGFFRSFLGSGFWGFGHGARGSGFWGFGHVARVSDSGSLSFARSSGSSPKR